METLTHLLRAKGAAHEMYADEDLKDRLLADFHQRASGNPRAAGGTLNLAYIFIEIAPDEFEKAATELEKLGITKPSDGSWELAETEEDA